MTLNLVPLQRAPAEDLIRMLRKVLATAEQGKINSMVIAITYVDGRSDFRYCYESEINMVKLVGEMELMKFSMSRSLSNIEDI